MTNKTAAGTAQSPSESPGFGKAYWRQEGGEQWAGHIAQVEGAMRGLNELLVEAAAPRPGEAVLDIGCGGGLTSFAVAQRVGDAGRVTGVDISPPIIAVAEARNSAGLPVEFILADAATAELGAGRYDLLISRLGIMFFEEPVAALAHLRRAMKQDGRLAALVWQALERNPWMHEPREAVAALIAAVAPDDEDGAQAQEETPAYAPGPFAFADAGFVQSLFSEAGFSTLVLDDVQTEINLGSAEQAVQLVLDIGPAAAQLRDGGPALLEQAQGVLSQLLQGYLRGPDVIMPAAAWIIRAGC